MITLFSIGTCTCDEDKYTTPKVAFSVRAADVEQSEEYLEDIPLESVVVKINSVEDTWIFTRDVFNFTAPINGAYYFQVTAIANGNGAVPLLLYHNDNLAMMTGRSDEESVGGYPLGSNSVVLVLGKDDVVSVLVKPKKSGILGSVFNAFSSPSDVSFSGHLLFMKNDDDTW